MKLFILDALTQIIATVERETKEECEAVALANGYDSDFCKTYDLESVEHFDTIGEEL